MPDLKAHAAGCKFYNCRHLIEPQCAVLEAVAAGKGVLEEQKVDKHQSEMFYRIELRRPGGMTASPDRSAVPRDIKIDSHKFTRLTTRRISATFHQCHSFTRDFEK